MRVTRDIEQRLHFNTAISAIMELVNELYKSIDPRPHRSDTWKVIRQATETVILLLSPFAPHIAEELWQILGNRKGLTSATWPVYDRAVAAEDTITLVVQVNGKVRSRLTLPANQTEDEVRRLALEDEKIQRLLDGMEVKRVVVVPNRLVNVVVVPRVAAELQQE